MGNFQGIQWGINYTHICSLGTGGEKIRLVAWHTQHIAKSGEDHVRLRCDLKALFDRLERGNTNRATWTVDQGNFSGQQLIEPVLHDGMRLPAANLHDVPRLGRDAADLSHDGFSQRRIPEVCRRFFHWT